MKVQCATMTWYNCSLVKATEIVKHWYWLWHWKQRRGRARNLQFLNYKEGLRYLQRYFDAWRPLLVKRLNSSVHFSNITLKYLPSRKNLNKIGKPLTQFPELFQITLTIPVQNAPYSYTFVSGAAVIFEILSIIYVKFKNCFLKSIKTELITAAPTSIPLRFKNFSLQKTLSEKFIFTNRPVKMVSWEANVTAFILNPNSVPATQAAWLFWRSGNVTISHSFLKLTVNQLTENGMELKGQNFSCRNSQIHMRCISLSSNQIHQATLLLCLTKCEVYRLNVKFYRRGGRVTSQCTS